MTAAGKTTDQGVPGRVAVGTVTRFGLVRQEPLARRRSATLGAWGCAVLAVAEVALSPVVGGVPLLAKAVLVIAVVTAVTFAVHRWVPKPGNVDVHPFWVKEVTGVEHPCRVRGSLPRGLPAEGTGVQVYGQAEKSGSVLVRELITDDGQVYRARLPLPHRIARAVELLDIALWAGAVLTVAWLLVSSP
ncbi:hypothetical protein [Lentzea cavernae]|uniref:PH domain-containing protein n=1 Tax=Lentzea cavernae TaxID=2020703 RepID=A0ABQ3MIN6_9PSEU|nr:hypothetical protein [Lentzea cavernae]GHH44265.1 hypothetical protein GCM10017774_43530 [Lentzea cavernae]